MKFDQWGSGMFQVMMVTSLVSGTMYMTNKSTEMFSTMKNQKIRNADVDEFKSNINSILNDMNACTNTFGDLSLSGSGSTVNFIYNSNPTIGGIIPPGKRPYYKAGCVSPDLASCTYQFYGPSFVFDSIRIKDYRTNSTGFSLATVYLTFKVNTQVIVRTIDLKVQYDTATNKIKKCVSDSIPEDSLCGYFGVLDKVGVPGEKVSISLFSPVDLFCKTFYFRDKNGVGALTTSEAGFKDTYAVSVIGKMLVYSALTSMNRADLANIAGDAVVSSTVSITSGVNITNAITMDDVTFSVENTSSPSALQILGKTPSDDTVKLHIGSESEDNSGSVLISRAGNLGLGKIPTGYNLDVGGNVKVGQNLNYILLTDGSIELRSIGVTDPSLGSSIVFKRNGITTHPTFISTAFDDLTLLNGNLNIKNGYVVKIFEDGEFKIVTTTEFVDNEFNSKLGLMAVGKIIDEMIDSINQLDDVKKFRKTVCAILPKSVYALPPYTDPLVDKCKNYGGYSFCSTGYLKKVGAELGSPPCKTDDPKPPMDIYNYRGQTCGVGLFMTGVKADGTLNCAPF